jgi:hypothetical protein
MEALFVCFLGVFLILLIPYIRLERNESGDDRIDSMSEHALRMIAGASRMKAGLNEIHFHMIILL